MERIDPQNERRFIVAEHKHRYQIALQGLRGVVLDCACGVGYAAPMICQSSEITQYVGIDISHSAVKSAVSSFKGAHAAFAQGDGTRLPFADNTFDSIVSLETVEHLQDPVPLLREFFRVLKEGGSLVSSVPTAEHEQYCTDAFGKNPYHFSIFSGEEFVEMLSLNIGRTTLYTAAVKTFTAFKKSSLTPLEDPTLGSYIAISTKLGEPPELTEPKFFEVGYLVQDEAEIVATFNKSIASYITREEELRKALELAEAVIRERDKSIAAYQKVEMDLRERIKETEKLVTIRDDAICGYQGSDMELRKALTNVENLVHERDVAIAAYQHREVELRQLIGNLESLVKDRDSSILGYQKLEGGLRETLKSTEELVAERDKTIGIMAEMLEERWKIIQEYEIKLQERMKP